MRLDPKTVHAPEIGPAWLNSPPLLLRNLRGRVVLLDFWDFTCVNCIRTLPYVREWHRRYEPLGLTTIGVHSPEFYFGQSPEILEQALAEFDIAYPVMLDNDYAIWKQFANKYWPSKYLIDPDGYIRYFHAGEGAYQETELAIQELLRERDPRVTLPRPMELLRPLTPPAPSPSASPPPPNSTSATAAAASPTPKASPRTAITTTPSAPAPPKTSPNSAAAGTPTPIAPPPPAPPSSSCSTPPPRSTSSPRPPRPPASPS